jgi:hypothetical protein
VPRNNGEEASDIARHALVAFEGAVFDVIFEKIYLDTHADEREADHDCIIAAVLDDVPYLLVFQEIDEGKQVLQAAESLHFSSPSSLSIFVAAQQLEAFPGVGVSGFSRGHNFGDRRPLELSWYLALDRSDTIFRGKALSRHPELIGGKPSRKDDPRI